MQSVPVLVPRLRLPSVELASEIEPQVSTIWKYWPLSETVAEPPRVVVDAERVGDLRAAVADGRVREGHDDFRVGVGRRVDAAADRRVDVVVEVAHVDEAIALGIEQHFVRGRIAFDAEHEAPDQAMRVIRRTVRAEVGVACRRRSQPRARTAVRRVR